ncbi:STAS domain-containing protein [Nocardia sp. NPDC058497]|uniref:STAS domain-containing protein n=1 Tax=Nocardia sp. NPDC058497 TaxID=3346529 RepID=UPI00364BB8EB
MEIKERSVNGVTILDLTGKLDIGVGDVQLREKIRNLMDTGKKQILLNLAAVSRIDSSGLGELVSSYTTLTNSGGKLKLVNLPDRVQDLLMITQLNTVFDTYDIEQEAIRSF